MRGKKSRSNGSSRLSFPTPGDVDELNTYDEGTERKHSKQTAFVDSFTPWHGICGAVLAVVFIWSYWPTFMTLVEIWNHEVDYSHGFIVPLLSTYFLWARRSRFPGFDQQFAWQGILIILLGVLVRLVAGIIYLDSLDGWSIILWIVGATWMIGGTRVVIWAWPALAYLLFMVPVPFRAERLLSYPLQQIATGISCFLMQSLGQPAISEGNVILLGDFPLNVEEACSGLRIFIAIFAVACAYLILVRRSRWEKALILIATIPIALISNATRIVATGLIASVFSSEAATRFIHDFAGFAMIPFATLLFGLLLVYLDALFPEVDAGNLRAVIQRKMAR